MSTAQPASPDVAARLDSDPANNFVLGAFVDGALVGTADFCRSKNLKEQHQGHIWGVYVTSAMRGTGVGLAFRASHEQNSRIRPTRMNNGDSGFRLPHVSMMNEINWRS
jgi:hypothetical protein